MSAHTPGPWRVFPPYLSEVQTPEQLSIATCWHESAEGKTITVNGILPCSAEESAANAALIASAPDLLAELTDALDAIEALLSGVGVVRGLHDEQCDMHTHEPDAMERVAALVPSLQAAIARAEGRAP